MKKFFSIVISVIVVCILAVVTYYLYDTFRERTFAEQLADIIHREDKIGRASCRERV